PALPPSAAATERWRHSRADPRAPLTCRRQPRATRRGQSGPLLRPARRRGRPTVAPERQPPGHEARPPPAPTATSHCRRSTAPSRWPREPYARWNRKRLLLLRTLAILLKLAAEAVAPSRAPPCSSNFAHPAEVAVPWR